MQYIGLSPSGVTRLLIPMEKIHLVEKEAHSRDARVTFVKLSLAGEELLNNAFTSFQHSAENLLQAINAKQTSQFLELSAILLK